MFDNPLGAPARMPAAVPANPMVIGQICHGSMGGSSRVAGRLANALARRGHRVHLFSREALPWDLDGRIIQHASGQSGTDAGGSLYWDWTEDDRTAFSAILAGSLREQHFGVLHYHYAQPFADIVRGIAAALGRHMPFTIGTLHGTDLTRCHDDRTALASLAENLAGTDVLTTVSRHMRQLSGALSWDVPALRVLPNFVEDDWPGIGERNETQRRASSPPSILHVSNFRAVKDVSLLARIFLAVHQQTGAELWLVGNGPELPALRRLLNESPAASVRILGASAEPGEYFRNATLFLSTSVEEGFGLAVLEAMASGVPVVATAVGGIPELVQNDVTGLLFHPGDFDETVRRIVSLLGSPERLAALRHASLLRADQMREHRVIALYENLYREALKDRARRPAR